MFLFFFSFFYSHICSANLKYFVLNLKQKTRFNSLAAFTNLSTIFGWFFLIRHTTNNNWRFREYKKYRTQCNSKQHTVYAWTENTTIKNYRNKWQVALYTRDSYSLFVLLKCQTDWHLCIRPSVCTNFTSVRDIELFEYGRYKLKKKVCESFYFCCCWWFIS